LTDGLSSVASGFGNPDDSSISIFFLTGCEIDAMVDAEVDDE
jgi:hypothetical protein